MMTLSIVINPEHDRVLMCYHNKQHMWNFIGGHVEECEDSMDASYRELEEETGITREDIELMFVRHESVSSSWCSPWMMYVTTGVLKKPVELKEEKNNLKWIELTDFKTIVDESFGFGNCLCFLRESLATLRIPQVLSTTYQSKT